MKVAFCLWGSEFFRNAVSPLTGYYKSRGHEVCYLGYNNWGTHKLHSLKHLDRVYFWNGEYPFLSGAKKYCSSKNIEVFNCEVAWFPQSQFIYVDRRGTNGNSSLFYDDLSWLEDSDYRNLEIVRESYKGNFKASDKGYVLVPLQLANDTSVVKWSPLRWVGDVVRAAQQTFPDREIIFRKHPKDTKSYGDLGICDSLRKGSGSDLKSLIMGSSLVWGMNSTVLLEAALMGKKVVTCGKSLLNIGQNREEALAALVSSQIGVGQRDLSFWMRSGRSLEHLNTV